VEYRSLGNSPLRVSCIGLGARSLGAPPGDPAQQAGQAAGASVEPDRSAEWERVVHRALDLGINLIDTADVYRRGGSEELLGRVLRGRRRQVILATKGGFRRQNGRTTQDSSPEYLRQAVEASLRRLRTDVIDLYQLHASDPAVPFEATARALEDLVGAGKIRYVGLSNVTPEELAAFPAPVVSIQAPLNPYQRDAEGDLLTEARRRGVGLLAYAPLLAGVLGGPLPPDRPWPPGDERLHVPQEVVADAAILARRLDDVGRRWGLGRVRLLLGWAASRPGVASVLVGASTVGQVEANAAAGQPLPPDLLREVEAVVDAAGVTVQRPVPMRVVEVLPGARSPRVAVVEWGLKFPVPQSVEPGDTILVEIWSGRVLPSLPAPETSGPEA